MTTIKDLERISAILTKLDTEFMEASALAEKHELYMDIKDLLLAINDAWGKAETALEMCEAIISEYNSPDRKRYNASPKFRVGSEAEDV